MSNAAVFLGGADVEVAAAGALSGDGAIGDPLKVNVDGVTILVNGSNQLQGASSITIGDTQVAYATSANTLGGDAGLKYTHPIGSQIVTLRHLSSVNASVELAVTDDGGGVFSSYLTVSGVGVSGYNRIDASDGSNNASISSLGQLFLQTKVSSNAIEGWDATGNTLQFSVSSAGVVTAPGYIVSNGTAIQTDTTTAHSALFQAYDVDGTAYKTFATLTNGNTPDFTIAPPSGGTVTLQATTYKSSDGSTGATGSGTVISAITVKNGLITAITVA